MEHRQKIEAHYPRLLDVDTKSYLNSEISKQAAVEIYLSRRENEQGLWELRFHLIQLLNYFEMVASAYNNDVADKKMIEDSFKRVMIRYHEVLKNFIDIVIVHRHGNPWQPYSELVNKWPKD